VSPVCPHPSARGVRSGTVRCACFNPTPIHPARQRDALTAQRRAASGSLAANTFQTIAEEWRGRQNWTGRRSDLVKSLMDREVYPDIGSKPIRNVKASDVRTIMDRLAARNAAHTALLVRQYIGSIFSYAVMTERADSDPSAPLRAYVKRPPVQHKRPLTRDEIPELLRRMETTRVSRYPHRNEPASVPRTPSHATMKLRSASAGV
jgi:integrase